MKKLFLKSCFFGIVALTMAATNILKCEGIESGDDIHLRPTAHSQDYTLTGYYEEIMTSFQPEKWRANGLQWCQLETKLKGRKYSGWCITNEEGGKLHYGATVTLKSNYYEFIDAANLQHKGGYLSARSPDEGYSVSANKEDAYDWEKWILVNPNNDKDTSPIPNKGKVALKSMKWGGYLCAKPDKTIIADRMKIGDWEKWTIEKLE